MDSISKRCDMMHKKWSPDTIFGSLRLEGERTVCTKTVYKWLSRGYIKDLVVSGQDGSGSLLVLTELLVGA